MRRIFIVLSTLVIIGTFVGFLVFGGGGNEKPLPDGSFVRIEKVAFGKEEHFVLGGRLQKIKNAVVEFWQTRVSHTWTPTMGGMSSWYMNAAMHSNEPALYIYISQREPGKGYIGVTDRTVELIDEDGCSFVPTQSGGWDDGTLAASTPIRGGMAYSVGWFRFEAFPRHQKKFRFILYEDGNGLAPISGQPASVEFSLANPTPPASPTNWPVESLPVTRTQDTVSFILSRLSLETNNQRGYYPAHTKILDASYKFLEDGQPSTNWQAVSAELYDSSGNFVTQPYPLAPCSALCPREAAWKLKVKFFGAEKSRAASNAVWTLHGLKVPGTGDSASIGESNVLQGVHVRVAAIGGAGDFTYSNGVALKAAPGKKSDYNSTQAVSWPNNWSGKSSVLKPTFSLHTKKPHWVIDVGDLSDDQRFTACAVDENGRQYYGYKVYDASNPDDSKPQEPHYLSNWYDSEGGFLLFDLPADAKTVDLILCVHTCRSAEFIFKPPQLDAQAAK